MRKKRKKDGKTSPLSPSLVSLIRDIYWKKGSSLRAITASIQLIKKADEVSSFKRKEERQSQHRIKKGKGEEKRKNRGAEREKE